MTQAVRWHSEVARDFDAKYAFNTAFIERKNVWSALIETFAHPRADVLDAGCGSGVLSALAARRARSVLGFDGSAQMIELAKTRQSETHLGNVTFRTAWLGDDAAFEERRFDLVLCSSVLEYVADYWHGVDWLIGALEPGGVLCLSMPNGDSFYRKVEALAFRITGRPVYYAHVRNVPPAAQLTSGLQARGLEVISTVYYAPAPLLSAAVRPLGLARWADNLFVVAARKSAGGQALA